MEFKTIVKQCRLDSLDAIKDFAVLSTPKKIGGLGGRQFIVGAKLQYSYCLNDLVRQLMLIAKKEKNQLLLNTAVALIQRLDTLGNIELKKATQWQKFCTLIKRFFGNLGFDRKAELAKLYVEIKAAPQGKTAPSVTPAEPVKEPPLPQVIITPPPPESPRPPAPIVPDASPLPPAASVDQVKATDVQTQPPALNSLPTLQEIKEALPNCISQLFDQFDRDTLFLTGAALFELLLRRKPRTYTFISFCPQEKLKRMVAHSQVIDESTIKLTVADVLVEITSVNQPFGGDLERNLRCLATRSIFKVYAIFASFKAENSRQVDPLQGCGDIVAKRLDFSTQRSKDLFFQHPLKFLRAHYLQRQLDFQFSPSVAEEARAVSKVIHLALGNPKVRQQFLQEYFNILFTLGDEKTVAFFQEFNLMDLIANTSTT